MTTYQIQIINHHLRAMQAYLLNIPVLGCDTLLIIPSRKIHMVSLSVWLSSYFSSYLYMEPFFVVANFTANFVIGYFGYFCFFFKIIPTDNFEPFWPIRFLSFLTYLVIFIHGRQNIPFHSNFCSKPRCLFKNMATPVFQFCTFVLFWFDSSCQTISYFVSYNESENLKTSADPCKSCKRQLKRLKLSYS